MAGYIVVDTDVLIDFFTGRSPSAEVVERLLHGDRLALTSVALFGLACGVRTEDQLSDLELLVGAARMVPLDAAASLRAGALYRVLRGKGELLETADLLIAGCCLAADLPLLTRNIKHFRRAEGLQLYEAEGLLEGEP